MFCFIDFAEILFQDNRWLFFGIFYRNLVKNNREKNIAAFLKSIGEENEKN
jgi:hypothetical protein